MAIPLQQHTRQVLGDGMLPQCESRSLFAARFADPESEKDGRKAWFHALIAKRSSNTFPKPTNWLPEHAEVVHARLMSRLMVDLAGGVMENANLNLDRYGLPRIPGSAVKGCARRMALQALHDWNAGEGDVTAPCREGFATPQDMLAAIARIFGWQEQDWSDEINIDKKTNRITWKSDFAWACAGSQNRSKQEVKTLLEKACQILPPHSDFAGTIAFLSASPNQDPGLELDVVTPHHTAYYEGKNPGAPDTEDPVPVYFPAVKPQGNNHHFIFTLIPLARAKDGDLAAAKKFLTHGLELMGLGAKTHAGYGWFEVSQELVAQPNPGDYENEVIFVNSVIKLLNQPGQYSKLQDEVTKLKKTENSQWLEKLRLALRGDEMKRTRRTLREKDWFPKEWLNAPQA